ncbi:H-2 class II histocompatibility antigen, E-S beta chain-like [Osmerus eperlanus]|uniref:H-2 class II histocompatibility antigen, E-S beta chain-like n=1 Tax=Osmerus eperlanus TaxID=29151 RepID=UPI002E132DC4
MSWSTIFFICMALMLSTQTADGYKNSRLTHCVFSSNYLHDAEYIDSYVFNKVENIRFNSTVGHFVGYTEIGIKNAEAWNKGPELAQEKTRLEGYCKHNAAIFYSNILDKHVKPSVRLSSGSPSSGRHHAMLVCRAYDYYPKQIKVTWMRDGQEVTSDVTSTEELVDGDWYYQIHSQLEYTPKSGEKISCMVEHASLDKPIEEHWDPSLPESEKSKIAIGASGLVLGLVLTLAGLIYYQRKKSNGRTLVPSG